MSADKHILIKGNEALAEAAISAGCRYYFGYPITPQNEIPAYFSRRLPEVQGTFLQSESEISAINMVFGAAASGARVMTSSSSPGISLKQEGISYLTGAQLPCVIVNIQRAGPGLGGIGPAQADYFQAVKGGGHGDYNLIVLAPSSVQEMADLTIDAFNYADKYSNPVMILSDATVGQMTEDCILPEPVRTPLPEKPWALTGASNRKRNIVRSFYLHDEDLLKNNIRLQKKFTRIRKELVRFEEYLCEDAEVVLVAYGISGRIARSLVNQFRKKGKPVGLIRPVTLWPFPSEVISKYASQCKNILVIEMSYGQFVEDVRLAVNGAVPVDLYSQSSGYLPYEIEINKKIESYFGGADG